MAWPALPCLPRTQRSLDRDCHLRQAAGLVLLLLPESAGVGLADVPEEAEPGDEEGLRDEQHAQVEHADAPDSSRRDLSRGPTCCA